MGYKRKKILHFHSFRVTCKISLVPGTGLVREDLIVPYWLILFILTSYKTF